MSIMRTSVALETERSGKKYLLITPKETSVGEIFDVCSEFLLHAMQLVEELQKEAEKKKAEARERLDKVVAAERESVPPVAN